MNRKIEIWGRSFVLDVYFDAYDDEIVLDSQKEALDSFINCASDILSSYLDIENYCIDRDGDLIGNSIDNIFKYVMPEQIYIKRSLEKRVVALLCNYRFDEEHGIALVFEDEKLKHIGPQDDVL